MSDSNSDLSDDIVPDELPKHTESGGVFIFRPWHKVRKHFIRQCLWNRRIKELVEKHLKRQVEPSPRVLEQSPEQHGDDGASFDRPLRCLVIPGDDLLDLRSLQKHLEPLGCFIRYLGFNDRQGSDEVGTRVHIANNEVTSTSNVVSDSQVRPERFQAVAKPNSQAHRYLMSYGPFHVVNLDFCSTLLPTRQHKTIENFTALHQLMIFQLGHQMSPWVMFLTTEVEPTAVDGADFESLCTPTKKNWASHSEFADRMKEVIPNADMSKPLDLASLSEDEMIRLFGVVFGKWLLDLGIISSPKWSIEMLPSYSYGIKTDPRSDMLSLAFQFRRHIVGPMDSTGLSEAEVTATSLPDEKACALTLIQRVEEIKNVDEMLEMDKSLYSKMESASADLLESAGADRSRYLEWLQSDGIGGPSP